MNVLPNKLLKWASGGDPLNELEVTISLAEPDIESKFCDFVEWCTKYQCSPRYIHDPVRARMPHRFKVVCPDKQTLLFLKLTWSGM